MDDKSPVTFCGLCCLDCHGHEGRIPDLARDLRKELKRAHYEKFADALSSLPFASGFKNYRECYEVLGLMESFRCEKGCREGGGPPDCVIRTCCREKSLPGCWECGAFESCEKLDFLNAVHGDAHKKNLKVLKEKGTAGFLEGKRYW